MAPGLRSRLLYLGDRLGQVWRGISRPRPETPPEDTEDPATPLPDTRPEGTVIWMHASTASDTAPIVALTQEVARLRGEPVHGLVTYVEGTLPASVRSTTQSVKAPGENAAAIEAFLDRFRPDLGVCLGLPDRPRLFSIAHTRGIPLYLASPVRGIAQRRLPMLAASLLGNFDLCLAPSGADARLLRAHLADPARVVTTGPLSDIGIALPCDERELDRLTRLIAARPVWMAAGPQPSEIETIEAAHREAARSAHRLMLILQVGDEVTGEAVARIFEDRGWRTARRSVSGDPAPEVQVFVADGPEDEAELWFRLASIVFLGGTLAGDIPADPFRAAAHGAAIIAGRSGRGAGRRLERLIEAGAVRQIDGAEDLGAAVQALLAPDEAAAQALAGWSVVSEGAHVIDRMARLIDEALDRAEAAR